MLIRPPNTQNLREIIGADPDEYDCKPEDVETSDLFKVDFLKDPLTEELLPTNLLIKISASSECIIETPNVKIQVQPFETVQAQIFSCKITPGEIGRLRVIYFARL